MKTKSFTLIEVLVASTIFMLVAMMAAASFAAVRQTNAKATDLKNTSECREVLQNFVQSEVKNSNSGARIMEIKFVDPNYVLGDVLSDFPALGSTDKGYSDGVAFIGKDGVSYKALYKNQDTHTYQYKEVPKAAIMGHKVPAGDEFLRTGDVGCFGSSNLPFQINKIPDNGDSSVFSIVVNLEDKIYVVPEPLAVNHDFAYVLMKAVNAGGGNSL